NLDRESVQALLGTLRVAELQYDLAELLSGTAPTRIQTLQLFCAPPDLLEHDFFGLQSLGQLPCFPCPPYRDELVFNSIYPLLISLERDETERMPHGHAPCAARRGHRKSDPDHHLLLLIDLSS